MDVTLLSGVVRNRKVAHSQSTVSIDADDGGEGRSSVNTITRFWDYLSGIYMYIYIDMCIHIDIYI
jgi:hypothetical protein